MNTFGISFLAGLFLVILYLKISGRSLGDFKVVIFGFAAVFSLITVSISSSILYSSLPVIEVPSDYLQLTEYEYQDSLVWFKTDTILSDTTKIIKRTRLASKKGSNHFQRYVRTYPVKFYSSDSTTTRIEISVNGYICDYTDSEIRIQLATNKTITCQSIDRIYQGNDWIPTWSIPTKNTFLILTFPKEYRDTLNFYKFTLI